MIVRGGYLLLPAPRRSDHQRPRQATTVDRSGSCARTVLTPASPNRYRAAAADQLIALQRSMMTAR